jgi:hypothetical protein
MGTDYYAVNIFGKLFTDESYEELDDKYACDFDLVAIGYDAYDEGIIVGVEANSVDQASCEVRRDLSLEEIKRVESALGSGCKYYIVQEVN